MSGRRSGFTLIELLIVVAIIAILALIAVPNFLEAQVRAKISRAKTDMRTIVVAEEAYRVDWNTYTHSNGATANPWDPGGNGRWGGFAQLTTPVAFLTSIPFSPFSDSRVWGNLQTKRKNTFHMSTGNSGNLLCTSTPWNSNNAAFPADCMIIESDGPDNVKDSRGDFILNDWPWPAGDRNDPAPLLAIVYDPTNGTVSRGQVFKVSGAKPAGRRYDVLYSIAN